MSLDGAVKLSGSQVGAATQFDKEASTGFVLFP